jgi:hypothetical protein
MGDVIYDQPPAGGCSNCGSDVGLSLRGGVWMCAECWAEDDRELAEDDAPDLSFYDRPLARAGVYLRPESPDGPVVIVEETCASDPPAAHDQPLAQRIAFATEYAGQIGARIRLVMPDGRERPYVPGGEPG